MLLVLKRDTKLGRLDRALLCRREVAFEILFSPFAVFANVTRTCVHEQHRDTDFEVVKEGRATLFQVRKQRGLVGVEYVREGGQFEHGASLLMSTPRWVAAQLKS